MIINFHPKEIPSSACLKLIEKLNEVAVHTVSHSTDKTAEEWKAIIKSDEKIIMVAPTYWWGMSYEFDKWLQDVFTYNFAFSFDTGSNVGLLDGREFEIHMTHATPTEYADIMHGNIKDRLKKGVFEYCNAKIDINFHFEKSL